MDVCRSYFNNISEKKAIDIATGEQHPGMYIFKELGFLRVVGTDILNKDRIQNNHLINNGIEYIKDDIIRTEINEKFDCVSCISVLEHLRPEDQKRALENMLGLLNDNGCILLTFDMPGFDYKTNLLLCQQPLA